MTGRATIAGGGFVPRVLAWPDRLQRRRRGDGRRGRGRRQASGRVVRWPHRFWPQRPEDIDRALICAYRLHCCGLLDDIDIMVREAELDAMRWWVK
jgi:hypothetical protein